MDDKREYRFLALAVVLVLASWAAVGWVLRAKHHRLYRTYSDPAVIERRLPDGRYLVRLPSGEAAAVEVPDCVAHQRTVMVFRREYLGGFKTQWRASCWEGP
jgi:hypothetical protein